jgi:transposase-like protein
VHQSTTAPSSTPPPVASSSSKKRTFSAAYKLQIVEELKDAPPGKVAEVLRREGLYSSHLTHWRRALGLAGSGNPSPKKQGRPCKPDETRRIERLMQKNEELERELAIARALLAIQKKASEILGLTLPPSEEP